MNIFLICPVRKITDEEKQQILEYRLARMAAGDKVYVPFLDTDQNDPTGYRICSDNLRAIDWAHEIHVWWNENSTGSLFDLGMAFALGKPVILANKVTPTEGKSFNNLLIAWAAKDNGGRSSWYKGGCSVISTYSRK